MVLYYLRFPHRDQCILYLYLGETEDTIYGLKSENVPSEDAEIIKKARPKILEKQEMLKWLKENVPTSYSQAYRELKKGSFILLKTHIFD